MGCRCVMHVHAVRDVFVFVHISHFPVFAVVYIHHASGRKFVPGGLSMEA